MQLDPLPLPRLARPPAFPPASGVGREGGAPVSTNTRYPVVRSVRCMCVTRWTVDFGDDRGVRPTTSLVAALASGVGLTVRLASVSTSPYRPLTPIPGVHYSGSRRVVKKNCDVCGWPRRVMFLRPAAGVSPAPAEREVQP